MSMLGQVGVQGVCLGGAMLLALLWIALLRRELRRQHTSRLRTKRWCEEMHAYVSLDIRAGDLSSVQEMAKQVCRVVAERSAFTRVALLERNDEGRLYVAGSAGADDLTVRALTAWAEKLPEGGMVDGRLSRGLEEALGQRVGQSSFAVRLERRKRRCRDGMPDASDLGCKGMVMMPMWTSAGKMVGVLAVCTDGFTATGQTLRPEVLLPTEALALLLGRAMESRLMAEQLARAERLVGLGQMTRSVAHALNNPLTAVLGFAELMVETAVDARVRKQAGTIVTEAKRMRETVQRMLSFWRPQMQAEEPVEVAGLLEELEDQCASRLERRGVRLVIQAGEALPAVLGSRERLREALEHLLDNAVQAISTVQDAKPEWAEKQTEVEEHVIRLTANYNGGSLHLIVSDTGPGFQDPSRLFDPLAAQGMAQEGAGVGLSVCYGIAREHGGEISAFNLQPHGAAVVLELPVGAAGGAGRVVVGEVA